MMGWLSVLCLVFRLVVGIIRTFIPQRLSFLRAIPTYNALLLQLANSEGHVSKGSFIDFLDYSHMSHCGDKRRGQSFPLVPIGD